MWKTTRVSLRALQGHHGAHSCAHVDGAARTGDRAQLARPDPVGDKPINSPGKGTRSMTTPLAVSLDVRFPFFFHYQLRSGEFPDPSPPPP